RLDRVIRHLALVRRRGAAEQAAVDPRVQRLDPTVEDLGRAGVRRHLGDRDPGRGQRRRRAAGRQDLAAQLVEDPGQLDHTGLVVDGNQRADHGARIPTVAWTVY